MNKYLYIYYRKNENQQCKFTHITKDNEKFE